MMLMITMMNDDIEGIWAVGPQQGQKTFREIDVDDHDDHPDDDHDYEKQPPGEYDMPWDHSNVI